MQRSIPRVDLNKAMRLVESLRRAFGGRRPYGTLRGYEHDVGALLRAGLTSREVCEVLRYSHHLRVETYQVRYVATKDRRSWSGKRRRAA